MIHVDIKLLEDLVAMSDGDDLQSYSALIASDLDRHMANLAEGVQSADTNLKSDALHGIYQVAASFGLTSLLQYTGELQGSSKLPDQGLESIQVRELQHIIDHSLQQIRQHN